MTEPDPAMELPNLNNLHMLVLGDVMLDRYWQGQADRVSPEAPVPVIHVAAEEQRPGGAANVALNLVSLGARCTLIGLIGADEAGEALQRTLTAAGVVCDFVEVPDWPTIVKLRLLAQQQQLLRADFEQPVPAIAASERLGVLQNKVEKHLQDADVLILEDYDKGAIEDPQALIHAARNCQVPVLVDPKMKPLAEYAHAAVVKPNEKEFVHALDYAGVQPDKRTGKIDMQQAAQHFCQAHDINGLVITRGGQGMDVCVDNELRHVPARAVEVFDVTGAGDTTAACLAVGMALQWPLLDSARLANVAASIAVSKSGTSPVTAPELRYALLDKVRDRGKLSRAELAQAVTDAKAVGDRIVFTNGCFDILHAGHVAYLEEAAALGDRLIVAINDDASVTRLKGEGRPVIPVEGRSQVLAGLACVDWVVSFTEDTPEPLLHLLQPDVLVKGGDYASTSEVVGADIVVGYGGTVQTLSLVQDVSTSAIVRRIQGAAGD